MRAQVVVLGPVEREMFVRLSEDLLPAGTKRAEELAWRVVGCGVEISERLAKFGLSAAIVTGLGTTDEDKEVLSTLRKRGVQLRGVRSDARTIPVTVRVQTPRHEVRMVASALDPAPSSRAVVRALPGARHFHVCGSLIVGSRSFEAAKGGLARAASSGVSASLDVNNVQASRGLRELLGSIDVLFTSSEALRAMTETSRIGDAAGSVLERGAAAVVVRLGAGGARVYSRDGAIRVPPFGDEADAATSAFASGYLLGWLLGANASVSGVLGGAAARARSKALPPDRRELSLRLAHARSTPVFRKLVPALAEAQRLLEKSRRLPRRDKHAVR